MNRAILWLGDPLHKMTRDQRTLVYALLTIYFGRLALWYGIEHGWGQP